MKTLEQCLAYSCTMRTWRSCDVLPIFTCQSSSPMHTSMQTCYSPATTAYRSPNTPCWLFLVSTALFLVLLLICWTPFYFGGLSSTTTSAVVPSLLPQGLPDWDPIVPQMNFPCSMHHFNQLFLNVRELPCLSACHMPDPVLSAVHVLACLSLTANLWNVLTIGFCVHHSSSVVGLFMGKNLWLDHDWVSSMVPGAWWAHR